MVLIYSLRKGTDAKTRERRRRARILLSMLEEEKARIVVPSIVVSEILVGIPVEEHGAFVAELPRRFYCPPFDLQAAALAADLWQKHKKLPKRDQLQRTVLKADVLIVASASVAQAKVFYSYERKCRRLATLAGLDARDLPSHHEDMFLDRDFRSEES